MAKKKADIFSSLPEDLTVKILLRVQCLKSIGRFKCVSKACRSLCADSQVQKGLLHGPERIFFLNPLIPTETAKPTPSRPCVATFTTNSDGNHSVTYKKVNFPHYEPKLHRVIQGSCHGLVLLGPEGVYSGEENDGHLILVNPTTQGAEMIPPMPGYDYHGFGYGFGYDSCTDDYKIISILKDFLYIYSVRDKTWRTLSNTSPYHYHALIYSRIFVSGRLTFPAAGANAGFAKLFMYIASFNLSTEEVESVPFPEGITHLINTGRGLSFADIGGCFAFQYLHGVEFSYEIYIMKEYGVQDSWTKFTIKLPGVRSYPYCYFGEEDVAVLEYERSATLECAQKLVAYNWRSGDRKDIIVDTPGDFDLLRSTRFRESLVSPSYNLTAPSNID